MIDESRRLRVAVLFGDRSAEREISLLSAANVRRILNPARYDVLLFGQRGCGRSEPHASTEANTTWHLVAVIERLRERVGVEQWVVFGGSWGSTLALAYVETHPERVLALIPRGVYTLTKAEIDWCYQFGASKMFPDKWKLFQAHISEDERHDMVAAYGRRLNGDDEDARLAAAKARSIWEGETITLLPDPSVSATFRDGHFALAFARLENHYFIHRAGLREGQLLADAGRVTGIPGTIVHGWYDMSCPARYAFALHEAWAEAEFHLVEGAGHAWSEPEIPNELIRETDRFVNSRPQGEVDERKIARADPVSIGM